MRHTEWSNDFSETFLVGNPSYNNEMRLNYTDFANTVFNLNFNGKIITLHTEFWYT
jgi:hypothetical protein